MTVHGSSYQAGDPSRRPRRAPAVAAIAFAVVASAAIASASHGDQPLSRSRPVVPSPSPPSKVTEPDSAARADTVSARVLRARQRPLSPMDTELMGVLDQEKAALAQLRLRFRATRDHREALAIQREIERLKVGTEVALLRIQADYARRQGRLATAQELEAAIHDILNPPVRPAVKPSERPATDGARR